MTLDELKDYLLTIDPALKKNYWNGNDDQYTVWEPHHEQTNMSDDLPDEVVIPVAIHRFAKNPKDSIIRTIQRGLTEKKVPLDDINAYYELDTGYWHWVLEAYAVETADF